MILRPVRPVSPCGPPTTNRPVGLIRNSVLAGHHPRREALLDDVLDAELLDLFVRDVGGVLGRDDDVLDSHRPAVFVGDRDLRLRVGPQPRHLAALADLGQLAAETVREHDRRRHQLGRLVAGVAEHQPLVAGALLGGLLPRGLLRVDALRDVRRLLRDQQVDEHLVGVEHVVVVDVADFADGLTRDRLEVELGLGRDFAADHHDVRLDEGFAGDAAVLVTGETRVEDRVGNRVGDLVGMPLADRFRGEDVFVHNTPKKSPRGRGLFAT